MASHSFLPPSGRTAGSVGGNLGSQLPYLAMETELQKLLSDEKARAEKHKINYQQLKIEHTRLQDRVLDLEAENKATLEESRIVKDKYLSMYEACKRDLAERIAECEELKTRVMTSQRLELIKTEIMDELERKYRERTNKQEGEVEEYRSALSKVRYELSFLKSEYEHDKAEFQQKMEESSKLHNIEMTNLRQDRDSSIAKIQAEANQDTGTVRVLQRENAQLHLQMKELLVEMDEIRAQREKSGLDADNVTRMQAKQLSEHQGTIRSLEAERESLRTQLDGLQREIISTTAEHNRLRGEIHELDRKNTVLKGHTEEVIHRSKVDMSDLKMRMLKERGEIEKEKDKYGNEVEDLRNQVDIAESKVRQLQAVLEDKEREIVYRVQSAREEEFGKTAKVENEKFELETKIQEFERRRIDDDARKHAEQEKNNDRLSQANAAKDQAERELIAVRSRLGQMESLQDQLDRERMENSSMKSRIHKLETELSSFTSAEHELTDSNIRMKNSAELLREELKLTQAQLDKLQNNHEVILMQHRSASAEDRNQLEARVHELEDKLGESQTKYSRASAIHKKLKKKTSRMSDHLKDKLQLLEAENTELDLEKKALQKCIPADQYNRLRKQWKDLWRRHHEFRTILLSVPSGFVKDLPEQFFPYVKSAKPPVDPTNFLNSSTLDNELEEQHQEDMRVLRVRLEALDKVQHKQLVELTDIARGGDSTGVQEKKDVEKTIKFDDRASPISQASSVAGDD